MSTQIRNLNGAAETGRPGAVNLSTGTPNKPELLYKMEDFGADVHMAMIMAREDGIITASQDRTIRIWLKRDNGRYWPSICQYMSTPPTAFAYNPETRKIFVGTESGLISEFVISNDFNRVTQLKDYTGHEKRITAIFFALECEWLLSCSRDKSLRWFCSESGRQIGSFLLTAWITALQFDVPAKYAFVGDYSGAIHVLRLQDNGHQLVSTIRGHAGSVRCLAWDASRQQLFSGGFDQNIVVWDIGGKAGQAYELQAHSGKVTSLYYASSTQQLISGGEDGLLAVWDMSVTRTETPTWQESDTCQQCNKPFFWNFKMMFDVKQLGMRQHHCRHCGKAICDACSPNRLTIPIMGFECPVRVCVVCYGLLKDQSRASKAVLNNTMHSITSIDVDETRKHMLTVGQDKVIKIWNVKNLLQKTGED
ncbi:hypothetical protein RvY_01633 [Ramazzottius varieornatus]|uniref:FYVE-type domain-containing protein n=1 Tax=Ramazzottius varieornatus TaxID=947166 RepID=A0A1D1UKV3_RAMVA|nr:hypothetical protein RvY_01633 [Ramazzottius varieornatus]